MRYIYKSAEPEALREYKALANPPDWIPTYEGLSGERKSQIKKALVAEQRGLCCYCESILKDTDSHIEHLKPQKHFENLALDYGNMLCSCLADVPKGEPLHCGMAKSDWYDHDLLISPLDPVCESHFRFLADGRIVPSGDTDNAAKETIKRLRLDDKELTAKRKEVIAVFLDETLTDTERDRLVADYLAEHRPEPSEFISAVKCVLQS